MIQRTSKTKINKLLNLAKSRHSFPIFGYLRFVVCCSIKSAKALYRSNLVLFSTSCSLIYFTIEKLLSASLAPIATTNIVRLLVSQRRAVCMNS